MVTNYSTSQGRKRGQLSLCQSEGRHSSLILSSGAVLGVGTSGRRLEQAKNEEVDARGLSWLPLENFLRIIQTIFILWCIALLYIYVRQLLICFRVSLSVKRR